MRIRAKIFLFIFITSFVIFALVIGYIAFNYRNYSIKQANKLANIYVTSAANSVKATLEKDLTVCETVALSFKDYQGIPSVMRDGIYSYMLKNILNGHPEYISVWMSWELRFIQPGYTKMYGRKRTVAVRDAGSIKFVVDTAELNGDSFGSKYYESKLSKKDVLVDPYFYAYSPQDGGDSVLETSIAKPILIDGEFAGVVGIDITLDRFRDIIDKTKPFENTHAFLISNNGTVIASPNPDFQGDSIISIFPAFSKFDVSEKIKQGIPFTFALSDSTGASNFISFAPIQVGKTLTPWAICLIVPSKVIEQESIKYFNVSLAIGSVGILLFSLITLLIARRITQPLKQTTNILKDLDKGIIDTSKKVKVRSNDELAEMGKSLNNLLDTLSKTAEFAKKIGEGNFDATYSPLSKFDVLGNTLVDMQKNLKIGQEQEEIRQLERAKLTWAQDGLTQLGEVLRTTTDNFEDYLYEILSHIVRYVKADQGGIFILNTIEKEHPYLELLAAFAYDKKKSIQAKIEIGESLVGRCFQEQEIIYMTNLPEGYTFVSSGLGGHAPQCLFLMPLIFEDEPFGVIELASFKEFAHFEIEFLRSIGERVASSTSIMQKNVHTKQLLDQFQIRSEELSRREQMLQETLVELQKAQESSSLKENENLEIMESISNVGSVVWYNTGGMILDVKDSITNIFNIQDRQLIGKNHAEFDMESKTDPEVYRNFWLDLKNGQPKSKLVHRQIQRKSLWFKETFTPLKDKSGNIIKIIGISIDVTEQRKFEEEIEKLQADIANYKKQINDILQ